MRPRHSEMEAIRLAAGIVDVVVSGHHQVSTSRGRR
jgi:hypothetical protein